MQQKKSMKKFSSFYSYKYFQLGQNEILSQATAPSAKFENMKVTLESDGKREVSYCGLNSTTF